MTDKTKTGLPRRAFLGSAAAGMSLLLAGCFGASPLTTYDLTAASAAGSVRRRSNRTVVVSEPDAVQTYDSERMVVRDVGGVLSYLPDSQWSDRLPSLIQTRIVQSFEDAGVPNVGRPSDQLLVDVVLATDVRAFDVDVAKGQLAVVTLAARLIDDVARRVIATRTFTASVPIAKLDGVNAAQSFDIALNEVVRQIIAWTAANA
jgi:cholesterol transport system auxiliary component